MELYLTFPEVAWTAIAFLGVLLALAMFRIAARNFNREASEPNPEEDPDHLRYYVARAHLRRVLIRLVRLLMNLAAGVVAGTTPPPIRHSVMLLEQVVIVVLVVQAALDTLDLLLDFMVAQKFYGGGQLPHWLTVIPFFGRSKPEPPPT